MTVVSYAPFLDRYGRLRTQAERVLAPTSAHPSRPPQVAGPARTPIKLGMRLMASLEHKDEFLMGRDARPRHTPTKERRIGIDRRTLRRLAERRRRLVLVDEFAY